MKAPPAPLITPEKVEVVDWLSVRVLPAKLTVPPAPPVRPATLMLVRRLAWPVPVTLRVAAETLAPAKKVTVPPVSALTVPVKPLLLPERAWTELTTSNTPVPVRAPPKPCRPPSTDRVLAPRATVPVPVRS